MTFCFSFNLVGGQIQIRSVSQSAKLANVNVSLLVNRSCEDGPADAAIFDVKSQVIVMVALVCHISHSVKV